MKKRVFGTKWVGIGRNQEISMPIDAPRSGDLENRRFGEKAVNFVEKSGFFCFWVDLPG